MTAPLPNYVHRARLAHVDELAGRSDPVHDGDTFYLRLDLGTYAGTRIDPVIRVRLAGIDTYELREPLGPAARDFTRARLEQGPVTAATEKPVVLFAGETLGRVVARVWIGDSDLADLLRAAGYEKPKPTV